MRLAWQKIIKAAHNPWIRLVFVIAVIIILSVLAGENKDLLRQGWNLLLGAENRYIALAIIAMAMTMASQAEMMVVLMRSAGVACSRVRANILGWAANAWSASLPGGPAISAAMIFREQMAWGATGVIASWYLVISGVISGAGMALLGVGSVFFLGAEIKPVTLVLSLAGLVALVLVINWTVQHLDRVMVVAQKLLRWFNRLMKRPEEAGISGLRDSVRQQKSVSLTPRQLITATTWSLVNWLTEILCLWACVMAVGGQPSVAGVALSFIMGKVVGQAQITPGGLGPVDIALTSALIPFAALPNTQAVGAVIIFRMVSFLLTAALGWLVFVWFWVIKQKHTIDVIDHTQPQTQKSPERTEYEARD